MSTIRRTVAVVGSCAAAAALAGIGTGAAAADTVGPVSGENDTVSFQRSVEGATLVDGKVKVGDTVTVTNRIDRKMLWLVYSVRDNHPSCLQAVPNTSVWTVSGGTYTNNPDGPGTKKPNEVTSGDGWVMIDATGGGSWEAKPLIWTQDYVVTCAPGTLNTGGLQWSTTNAFEKNNNKPDVGPTITVVPASSPGGGDGSGGDTGSGGTGSGGDGSGGEGTGGAGGSSGSGSSGSGSLGSGSLSNLFG
ncbi:hypothetical protein [Gordonia sihwensis]|uniref:hypothetical protein n=1 Tax=Gordonia sihwensis TaxID=173559 RepID=UPI001C92E2D8|nr:hypothetical protein [Gordonia sihwensis]